MSVGTWGPGTGATGTGAHPFCLRIQGVCYIGSVDLSSVVVNASVSSNATLTFTIWDATSSLPVPEGWADVEFADRTEQEVIFGGLVMGVEVEPWAVGGRRIDVRCVDYGILLDVTPVMSPITFGPGSPFLMDIVQGIAAVAPLGGLMALEYGGSSPGRLFSVSDMNVFMAYGAETVTVPQVARAPIEAYAARQTQWDLTYGRLPVPAEAWVTPLRQLYVGPIGWTVGSAPLQIRQNPSTSAHIAAESITVDEDARSVESGVWVADSDTTYGGDNSGWHRGTINGYSVMPSSITERMFVDSEAAVYGARHVLLRTERVAAQATVTTVKNFLCGQALTVYYPSLGLDGTYAITAVSTRFLGGLRRQSTIQFNGERATLARFNRTRFARAGVRT